MTTDIIDQPRSDAESDNQPRAILDAVRAMVPAIAACGDEIERGRRLPPDLVDQLRDAGCFRMLVPRQFGGAELELADYAAVVRELARADGAVGWTVMIGSAAPAILGMLPATAFADVYAEGPDVVLAGAFNPTGVATPDAGGFRVAGRWSFASGCQHADWFVAHCMVDDGRVPPMRMMVLPAADVEIVDTWTVSGLCGTGSHDFTIDDVFVPAGRTFAVFDEGGVEGPLGRIPELSVSSLAFANVALGIAEGALAEITTLATAKVPLFAEATLATNPLSATSSATPTPTCAQPGRCSTQIPRPPGPLPSVAGRSRPSSGPGLAARRRGSRPRLPPSSTPPTPQAAPARSTRPAHYNVACVTSTRSPNTSPSNATHSPSSARSSPAKTSTSASSDGPGAPPDAFAALLAGADQGLMIVVVE